MIRAATRLSMLAMLAMGTAAVTQAAAETAETLPALPSLKSDASPLDLSDGDKARYNAVFAALRAEKWADARAMIQTTNAKSPMAKRMEA